MGIKLSEVEDGSEIVLYLSKGNKRMKMAARIIENLREDAALIELDYETTKRLSFEGIDVDMEYNFQGMMPIIWHKVKVLNYKSQYILQTSIEGIRKNRRNCFRVGVSTKGQYREEGHGTQQIVIRDISLSGFSVTDDANQLEWQEGDRIDVCIEDIGYCLNLIGKVVRIEERRTKTIYGLEICNLCRELSSYISMKQRRVVKSNFRTIPNRV